MARLTAIRFRNCETLSKEAAFVADCGADGIIWPAANDAMKWLSPEEERRGLEAIAIGDILQKSNGR